MANTENEEMHQHREKYSKLMEEAVNLIDGDRTCVMEIKTLSKPQDLVLHTLKAMCHIFDIDIIIKDNVPDVFHTARLKLLPGQNKQ